MLWIMSWIPRQTVLLTVSFKDIYQWQKLIFLIGQGDGAGKDVLTGLSNGMDRHKSKDKV